ncbi:MAG: chromate efflux transporter [Vicinamibacteraceae bacterium]|nr:chromate efflux transporter [Vicinamibacteraceae bacterium]
MSSPADGVQKVKILPTPETRELAAVFLRLGTTAFGGPAAHIAMMEDEVVGRRRWLTREQFLDYLGATNLIPGPNSTELAIHIGHARGGWPGLVVAGVAFIVPAMLIVTAAAWAYQTYGSLPQAAGFLYGVKPVIIAVVAQALWGLGRTAVKGPALAVVGLAAVAAVASGLHELVVLAAAGIATVLWTAGRRLVSGTAVLAGVVMDAIARSGSRGPGSGAALSAAGAAASGAAVSGAAAAATSTSSLAGTPFALWTLFLVFAKAGSVLFGSGYVLLAFLRADLVERLGWLTEAQLLDAIAVGQVTPGPVFTTATFVGYVLGGPAGAIVATVGIFLPAFVFVALSGPLVPRLRRSAVAGAALDGVNVASLALMAVVAWQLGRAALVDPLTVAMAVASLAALVWARVNSAWLVLAGALVGMLT